MTESHVPDCATLFQRRELLVAGVGMFVVPASPGLPWVSSGRVGEPLRESSIRLLLKSISISRTTTIVVASRLENHSDDQLTFQLNHWETGFEFGMRFWRIQSDEVFAFAPNYPPGIPTRPPPTILAPGSGIDFEIRPLVSSPGFMKRDPAGHFDCTRPVALPRGGRYVIDSVARVYVRAGDGPEHEFTVSSWNKLWHST